MEEKETSMTADETVFLGFMTAFVTAIVRGVGAPLVESLKQEIAAQRRAHLKSRKERL